jgi:hypothetical protein
MPQPPPTPSLCRRRSGCAGSGDAQCAPQQLTLPAASSAYVVSPPPVTSESEDPTGAPSVTPQHCGEPLIESAQAELAPAATYEKPLPAGVASTPEALLPAAVNAPETLSATRKPPPSERALIAELLPSLGAATRPPPKLAHVPSARFAANAALPAPADPAKAPKGEVV